ncbi:UDP-N-acetylmuramoyl-L-alanyl-D-glutamate--2,6-diaminopimelate ligase [SAR92 clade bacterium H921]|nr:UDP-N-acetylmuramoyl-L-alanyl-D-glutamate--2,6-diaminopimelate ligase [SAR92 clade bacterium H921]
MMSLSQHCSMTLPALVAGFVNENECPCIAINGIALDSRQVQDGDLFIAIKGTEVDGANFIPQAIDKGAAAILIEKDRAIETLVNPTVPIVGVEDLAKYVSHIAGTFYGHPSKHMALTAFTGTNGKTTCSRLYAELIEKLSNSLAGFVGTLGYGMAGISAGKDIPLLGKDGLTTPDAVALQRLLAQLRGVGADTIAMEVSSHSLVQHRVAGLQIETAVFTNLSRDHLDYHGDLATYSEAKSRLFSMPGLQNAVINIDDSVGRMILAKLDPQIRPITYSAEGQDGGGKADIFCHTVGISPEGLRATIHTPWGSGELISPLLGRFNLANLLAVIGAAIAQGFSLHDILQLVPELHAVPGRMELVDAGTSPSVVVDYAHTPDALEKALQALRVHCQGRLWVVFGCGGDRDVGKRAEMGAIADTCADQLIITSDNPRSEDPQQIIDHIVQGVSRQVLVESDRRAAIRHAVLEADKNDVVLIAGKGHEDYQILGAQRLPFSDQGEARLALRARQALSLKGGLA